MPSGFFGVLNSLQVITTVAIVFWILFRDPAALQRRAAFWWAVAWVVVASASFWIAGPYSWGHRFSELDCIPLVTVPPLVSGESRYLHNFAGGVDAYAIAVNTGQYLSLERLLFQTLPVWPAYAIHKICLYTIYMIGSYKLARGFGASRAAAIGMGALSSMAMGASNYVTVTHGFAYALAPLVAYLTVVRQGRRYYWSGVLAVSVAFAISSSFPHAMLSVLAAVMVVALFSGIRPCLRSIPALALFFAIYLLNWHEAAYAMATIGPYTHRGAMVSWATGNVGDFAYRLYLRLAEFREVTLVLIAATALLVWRRGNRWPWIVGCVVLFLVIGPAMVEVPWQRLGLGVLGGYNFHYLLFAMPVVCAAILGLAEVQRKGLSVVAILVVAVAGGRLAWSKGYEASVWLSEGGLPTLIANKALHNPTWLTDEPTRVVSVPYRLPMTAAAMEGLDTFDGTLSIILRSSAEYWQLGINRHSEESARGGHLTFWNLQQVEKCCASYDLTQYVNIDLLRAANVGFIASRLPLAAPMLTLVDGPADQAVPPRATDPLLPRLRGYLDIAFAQPRLYIYRITAPLPRVWAAKGVLAMPDGTETDDLLEQVAHHVDDRVVVVAHDDGPALTDATAEVRSFSLVDDGFSVHVDAPQGGVIVFNVPYLPFWQITADGHPLPTVPANGVQMAVAVPPGTREVTATYIRPLLREKIRALF